MSAERVIDDEERARAHCYAILGRLMYGPPDAAFVSCIDGLSFGGDATVLAQAWRALEQACRAADLDPVRLEYDDLFVGVGKSPVTLYTAAYVAPQSPDRHLLALRNALDEYGLARRDGAGETEDHVSGLFDTMRCLIEESAGLAAQRQFFFEFVAPAIGPLCGAIAARPHAAFYRRVAAFMQAYCDVERAAFEIAGAAR